MLRSAAAAEPGVRLRSGHAGGVLVDAGRVTGLRVDDGTVQADLIVNASGRSSRFADAYRALAVGGPCPIGYVSRHYELHPGAEPGPSHLPVNVVQTRSGYLAAVFRQDHGTFSTVLATPRSDRRFTTLRHAETYELASRAVPGLAEWGDPQFSRPLGPVQVGGGLDNTYRGQLDDDGRVAAPGLVHLGDAVCTTNPTAGRGISLALEQSRQLCDCSASTRTTSPRPRTHSTRGALSRSARGSTTRCTRTRICGAAGPAVMWTSPGRCPRT
ncbi:hypothetical protein [Actinoplanes sp. NPDC049265]|uniref:hypothetical protein n=1 Tax=Actinoplanes sp. NPDC049265 TaxID=3363902 RepID=UPI00371E8E16